MRIFSKSLLAAAALTLPLAATVQGAGHGDNPYASHIAARQGYMQILAFNIGVLGGMARGNIDYDAEAAQTAANNLAAMAGVDGRPTWPAGSDNAALGDATRALPAIWEDMGGFGEEWMAYGAAASGMADAAGNGLEALQAAIGPLGGSCGSCHRNFRQSDD
ncbi:c-type cytochrome [Nioella sediminis]|uniref:c-type cytochrome n=1 Tax=Nioella sediminis TaxID=1912092 RepID=UPI0008FD331E|nr:cytochrome c [Nioella sediminis]TBX27884.1 hypothetical protein TK43_08650 [Roseovarius sp. JS7-11]